MWKVVTKHTKVTNLFNFYQLIHLLCINHMRTIVRTFAVPRRIKSFSQFNFDVLFYNFVTILIFDRGWRNETPCIIS